MLRLCTATWPALALVAFFASMLNGEDWPRFRGPNGTGVSRSQGLPAEFGPERNVVWRVDSGAGSSSPVIADGRLYFTSFENDTRTVHCLDASTGQTLWTRSVEKVREENASRPNGPATCTPVTDGANLVVFFPDTGLLCYSASGRENWRVDAGPFHTMHGVAGSPIIAAGHALLLADQLKGSYLAAYDLDTGKLAWKVERMDGLTGAYSTPSVLESRDGSTQIVASGPHELVGYLAATGDRAWSVPGVTNSPVSVPVVAGTCVFLCEPVGTMQPIRMLAPMDKNKDGKFSLEEVKASVPMLRLLERIDDKWGNGDAVVEEAEWEKAFGGFVNKGGLVAIDLHEAGGRVEPQVRWNYRKTVPYVASVLVLENVLYFVQDGGIVTSVDCESGLVSKRQRLKQGGKKFYASPVAADGKILIIDTEGQVAVLRAGSEWEVLTTSSLGEPCFATPAICEGRIYVRTVRTLYCFAESR